MILCSILALSTLGCDSPKQRHFASIEEVLETNNRYAEYELLETIGTAEPPYFRSGSGDVVSSAGKRKRVVRYIERGMIQRRELSGYEQEILVSFLQDASDNACVLVLGRKPKNQD
jgi:hypothetical protein